MKTFSKHYCVTIQEDGTPREIGRLGSVVTYKAVDYRTGRTVALQVIPSSELEPAARAEFEQQARALQKIDHVNIAKVYDLGVEEDHLVFVSEFLQGEASDAWVVANGPMPADATVRIALQVVSALQEATFHGLSHRALQPSNLLIANGPTPDGDWPLVKLLNLGLAALQLHGHETGPHELISSISPAFASPEQLQNGKVDFRSEIFSLGASLCFLLTGAVPLMRATNRAGVADRSLPPGIKIPRALRKILRQMLRHDPDQRPHDPVLLTEEFHRCLRKIGHTARPPTPAPVAPILPVADEPRARRLWPIAIGATALLLACAAAAAFLFPDQFRSLFRPKRDLSSIGVPIGVPENSAPSPAAANPPPTPEQTQPIIAHSIAAPPAPVAPSATIAPVALNNRMAEPPPPGEGPIASPSIAPPSSPRAIASNSPPAETQTASSPTLLSPPIVAREQIPLASVAPSPTIAPVAVNNRMAEPPRPGEGPIPSPSIAPPTPAIANNSPPAEAETAPSPTVLSPPIAGAAKSKSVSKTRRRSRVAPEQTPPRAIPALRVGSAPAEFVGVAKDGRWILRVNPDFSRNSSKSEIVLTPPPPDTADVPPKRRHRSRHVVAPKKSEVPLSEEPPVTVLPPEQ